MKPSPPSAAESGRNGESPDVPGFRTWRGVYLFVFSCFLVFVAALTCFARYFA